MQSEEDWDDGEDWDEDYDDSESSSLLDMELATKMKIAGAVGIALLIILSSYPQPCNSFPYLQVYLHLKSFFYQLQYV